MAITFTQSDLDALVDAWKTGAKEVVVGDQRLVFREKSELEQMIKTVQDALDVSADKPVQTSLVQATYSKGRT